MFSMIKMIVNEIKNELQGLFHVRINFCLIKCHVVWLDDDKN